MPPATNPPPPRFHTLLFQQHFSATLPRFLSLWISTLKLWSSSPSHMPITNQDLQLFVQALNPCCMMAHASTPLSDLLPAFPLPPPFRHEDSLRRLRLLLDTLLTARENTGAFGLQPKAHIHKIAHR